MEETKTPKSYKLKIILGGAKGVGKSSFIEGDGVNDSPIGVSFKPIECYANQGDSYKFVVWDLKDRERFRFLFPLFCRGACTGLLCFDVSNKQSFLELNRWVRLFRGSAGNIPIFLIGTKNDLDYKAVSEEEINKFIQEQNIECVFFTSIYDEDNKKEEIFKRVVQKIDEDYPLNDFTIISTQKVIDEEFKKFLDIFDKCPICKRENHFESLKNLYFNKNNPDIIRLRESLLYLIEQSINLNKLPLNRISFGIPCCSCYKTIFNENC
ncbi:MAG: Rab family GTPase [Candidatus Hodarchaeota archaeon]